MIVCDKQAVIDGAVLRVRPIMMTVAEQRASGYTVEIRYASRSGIISLSITLIMSFNSSLRFFSRRMRN